MPIQLNFECFLYGKGVDSSCVLSLQWGNLEGRGDFPRVAWKLSL